MSELEYRGVSKEFGDSTALADVSLTVEDGSFLVLLGPSGCGKTTSLRIGAGLEEPTSGGVLMGGEDITHLQPKDRDIAMVFQSYALYPHMTVEENIGYPLKIRKQPREQRVREVAEQLGVESLLDRRPRHISGGQRQRVALARAIIRQPACFFMDEPLSNLDAQLRVSARAIIKHLQQELRTTTIYVTHDQTEAMTMADTVAVMHEGRLQQVGSPRRVYYCPENLFVATFLGSPPISVLAMDLDWDRRSIACGHGFVAMPEPLLAACAEHRAVQLGVRPEDLSLTAPDQPGALAGQVYVVEPLGNETLVEVELGEARVRIRTDASFNARPGTGVGVAFDPATACFFNSDGTTVIHRTDEGARGALAAGAPQVDNGVEQAVR